MQHPLPPRRPGIGLWRFRVWEGRMIAFIRDWLQSIWLLVWNFLTRKRVDE